MDVRLSPEQHALRDSVAKVVADLAPRAVGELDDEGRRAKLDAAVTAAGWRELRTADETGAPYASAVEAALVAEELSRGLADVAFIGPTLAAELRRRAGTPAADEPETVVVDGIAVDCAGASHALVVTADGLTAIAIDGPRLRTDLTRETSPVAAASDVEEVTALGLALTAAELVGTMRGAVELATTYAQDRRQYGTAIGSFQAVQHLLADAHVAMEGSRSVALHAAWAVDALDPADALAAASVAKAYCARAARTACETAIQVHGGIGNTWECLAHVHLRRALLSIELFGGVGPSLERVLAHHEIPNLGVFLTRNDQQHTQVRGGVGGGSRGLR